MPVYRFAVHANGTGGLSSPSGVVASGDDVDAAREAALAHLSPGESLGSVLPSTAQTAELLDKRFAGGAAVYRINLDDSPATADTSEPQP